MEKNLSEQMLRQFQDGIKQLPEFKTEEEEKIFLQLQKYNLIHITTEGFFRITRKGQEALKGNVENYLFLESFEEKLIKDSFKKTQSRKLFSLLFSL